MELGPATGTSEAGSAAGATGATGVVATGCVHCIGVVVAGLAAALVAAEGLEGTSGDVGRGESSVPERGFLPRLAVDEGVRRCLALVEGELEGFAGMKVRSWKGDGSAMMAGWEDGFAEFGQVDPPRLESVDHGSQFIHHFTLTRPSVSFFLRRLFISGRRSVSLPRRA